MANRFVQAKSHGGGYRAGQPTLLVIHSLEAPARRGLAWDLANGWIQNAGVSPHSMTDPGETVDLLNLSTIGWHCGNGNQVGIGLEVTGYAAWSFEQWTTGDAFAAVRLDAKRAAEVAKAKGIPLRWLSLQQIRNGESGFCTHADISATLGGTNHTDPGPGFPYAIFMQMVQQFAGGWDGIRDDFTPNPQPAGPGGAEPKEWDETVTKDEWIAAQKENAPADVIFFQFENATYEHDVATGTAWPIPPNNLEARQYILTVAGRKFINWPGGQVANPLAFGVHRDPAPRPN